jgi:hypothetical protein
MKALPVLNVALLAAGVLLTHATAWAQDTPFTATGWVNGMLSPGFTWTNNLGQVLLRANIHTARVQASDPRMTGQELITVDGA